MAHISEKVVAALLADGWVLNARGGGVERYQKRIVGAESGGAMVPDGARVVNVQICAIGRWFERVDGWGKIEKDVDLRNFDNPAAAIAAVLQKEA
jgi:hypothetical protein